MRAVRVGGAAALLFCLEATVRGQPAPAPWLTHTPTPLPNYLELDAELASPTGAVKLSYQCDFQLYDYQDVPLYVYLAAIENPKVAGGPASLADAVSGGSVHMFGPGMKSTYVFNDRLQAPTFTGVAFPQVPIADSMIINTVTAGIYEGTYAFAAVFIRKDTGGFVRTDDFPVSTSPSFTPFRYRVNMISKTRHVGDSYDPYMAHWEVPHPEGTTVNSVFTVSAATANFVLLRGGYFATYDPDNPVYINGRFLGYIPGLLNGASWHWSSVFVSPDFFRLGQNVITFKSARRPDTGHPDDYMVKGWTIYYN